MRSCGGGGGGGGYGGRGGGTFGPTSEPAQPLAAVGSAHQPGRPNRAVSYSIWASIAALVNMLEPVIPSYIMEVVRSRGRRVLAASGASYLSSESLILTQV